MSVALSLAATACGGSAKTLTSAYPSADALAAAVLEALARADRAALETLALSEAEFEQRVWPELPASKPERNLPVDYVWGDLSQKSRTSLATVLKENRGKRYRLRRVAFAGVTIYPTYRVHRDARFDVADSSGVERSIRVCGSMIETDAGWKVFSYVVD